MKCAPISVKFATLIPVNSVPFIYQQNFGVVMWVI